MASSKRPPPPAAQAPGQNNQPPQRIAAVRTLVRKTMPQHIATLLPKGMDVDRFCKVFLTQVEQSMGSRSDLTKCTDGSLARALLHSAEVNLQVGGPYPHAYVIPYWNSDHNADEAQFQISVWGYTELFRRSGLVKKVWADVIYEHDEYECSSGTDGKIVLHKPRWFAPRAERGRVVGSYACALLHNGETVCEPVSFEDLETARAQNRGKSPAWDLWFDQQAQKVAIKRMGKYLPKGEQIDRAHEIDDDPGTRSVIDVEGQEMPNDQQPSSTSPLDQVVAKESAKDAAGVKPDKLVIDRNILFGRLCDLDERWRPMRPSVDAWSENDALLSMAYLSAIMKEQGPDSILPELPQCMRVERMPGEEG